MDRPSLSCCRQFHHSVDYNFSFRISKIPTVAGDNSRCRDIWPWLRSYPGSPCNTSPLSWRQHCLSLQSSPLQSSPLQSAVLHLISLKTSWHVMTICSVLHDLPHHSMKCIPCRASKKKCLFMTRKFAMDVILWIITLKYPVFMVWLGSYRKTMSHSYSWPDTISISRWQAVRSEPAGSQEQ